MRIGTKLQQQRKLHNMSQADLAKKLNISRQSISKWENGLSLPSFSNVVAISDLFQISLDELIRGDDELMNKFAEDKIKFSKLEWIYTLGLLLVVIGLFIIYSRGISTAAVEDWLTLTGVVSLVGFLKGVKWQGINKWGIVFGVILVVSVVVPYVLHEVPDIVEGMREASLACVTRFR